MNKDCPVCGNRLEQTRELSELTRIEGGPIEVDEWWCNRCQEYFYREDFFYETDEEENDNSKRA